MQKLCGLLLDFVYLAPFTKFSSIYALKRPVNYTVIRDADSLFDEALRVWNGVDLQIIKEMVQDFDPRLRACVAVHGQCLKPVLCGYRLSDKSGDEEIQQLIWEQQRMQEFLSRNSELFHLNKEEFVVSLDVSHADPGSENGVNHPDRPFLGYDGFMSGVSEPLEA